MSSTTATPSLTTWELVKMSAPIIFFGILLPTVDSFTDLRMIIRLFIGIPACKHFNPNEYFWFFNNKTQLYEWKNGTHWQDLWTCTQDPEYYCQSTPWNIDCDLFYKYGYPPVNFPGCSWDYWTCKVDPVTFCQDDPDRLTCAHYKHTKFASMFLGIFFFTHFKFNETLFFQRHLV